MVTGTQIEVTPGLQFPNPICMGIFGSFVERGIMFCWTFLQNFVEIVRVIECQIRRVWSKQRGSTIRKGYNDKFKNSCGWGSTSVDMESFVISVCNKCAFDPPLSEQTQVGYKIARNIAKKWPGELKSGEEGELFSRQRRQSRIGQVCNTNL